MRADYAKGKSHAVMKEDGTFGKAEKKAAAPKEQAKPAAIKPKADASKMDADAAEPAKPKGVFATPAA